jgi:tetratricopeptide (TPR) repeat protein
MGVVYEAEDTRLGRHVALKLLPVEASSDQPALDRFLREARIVSSLSHPHICTLHDIGEHEGRQFMVMELLEGESFKQRLSAGALPMDDVLALGIQIADALDAAHAHGVVHRDIKPANLFVTRRGLAKVLDFGVAKLAGGSGPDRPDVERTYAASELTTVGSAVGTVAYMSPEQARGQDIDTRSDLFSFGLVLYEMATGRPAFGGATAAVIFEGILTRQPEPPSRLNGNIPLEFDHIVLKALEKDRETRYQSAAELRADLKRLQRQTDTGNMALTGVVPPAGGAAESAGGALHGSATGTAPGYAVGNTLGSAAGIAPPGVASANAKLPRQSRTRRALLIGAPMATAAAIAAVFLWQSQRTPALTERDTVVLSDFRNTTGDAMFDDTLTQALAVQLRQSPFLNILPDQQIEATLQMMGRRSTEPLTAEVAREVCVRTGARALLGGSIAAIGNQYLLTLSAQDCVNGNTLAEEAVDANGKDAVLASLGRAATAFRERLGESLASVQRYDMNIEQATTTSLDALKAYSQGMTTRRTQGDLESVPFFKRAVEIDPEFALGHARLGTVLSNLGQSAEATAAATRAFELREKASERERLYIEARYHSTVTRDTAKAIEAYRLLLATYPDDYAAHSNVGGLYRSSDEADRALFHLEEAVRIASMQPLGHLNLAGVYLDAGRFGDARREYEAVLKLQENVGARQGLITVGTFIGDDALVKEHVDAARGPRSGIAVAAVLAQAYAYRGRMKAAAQQSDEFFRQVRDEGRLSEYAEGVLGLAINQAVTGHFDEARRQANRVLQPDALSNGSIDEVVALGALINDRKLVDDHIQRSLEYIRKTFPPDQAAKGDRAIRALQALSRGQYQEAYELGVANGVEASQRTSLLVAGMAAIELRRWDEAARLFQTVVGFGTRLYLTPIHAYANIMLGRAHAGAGRMPDARKAYERAFEIWKDADADVPLLVAARSEYQRLTS